MLAVADRLRPQLRSNTGNEQLATLRMDVHGGHAPAHFLAEREERQAVRLYWVF